MIVHAAFNAHYFTFSSLVHTASAFDPPLHIDLVDIYPQV
jgi:hypothetical protein